MSAINVKRLLFNVQRLPSQFIGRVSISQRMFSTGNHDEEEEVILRQEYNKGLIILNRPKKLNALNLSMIRKIYPQLKEWEMNDAIKMVIIKGAGEKAFCSGGDIKAMASGGKGSAIALDSCREGYALDYLIGSLKIPYVSLINGFTMGSGGGLSILGTRRIVTEKALYAMPETRIGFFPDDGATYYLSRLPKKLGFFLGLTGTLVQGYDIKLFRLATHYIASRDLQYLENDLISLKNPNLREIDLVLSRYEDNAADGINQKSALAQQVDNINLLFDGKTVEEIVANLDRSKSSWATSQLDILSKMCPTSLKVTLEAFRRGSQLSLGECLKMEHLLAYNMMHRDDFFEGVRALLVDKDNKPKWNPSSLAEVTDSQIEEIFTASPNFKPLEL